MKSLTSLFEKNIVWILPAVTAGLFALLVVSMLVPKEVIDTLKINVIEEGDDEESMLPLQEGSEIAYEMNTGTRPLKGLHVAVAKNGGSFEKGSLQCAVYKKGENHPVSETNYLLSQGEDLQYIYLPSSNAEACVGDLSIRFMYSGDGNKTEEYPGLLANGRKIPETATKQNGKIMDGSLKIMYVYTHNTYPLVYDLRILTLLSAAASMTLSYSGISTFIRKKHHREERG